MSLSSVVSIFGVEPRRIGGVEIYARELSAQLHERGWKSVLCFLSAPPEPVRQYLSLPNVTVEALPDSVVQQSWRAIPAVAGVLRRHRPRILHLQFTPFVSPYAWVAYLNSVENVFFTDQGSRPEGYQIRPAPAWKRAVARWINLPVTRVVAISDYVCRCQQRVGLIAAERVSRIYNATDIGRANGDPALGNEFRRRYGIPARRILAVQVSWIIPEKGIPDLLEAARLAVAQVPDLHFAFAGDGAYLQEYARRAKEMGISDHVTWTGLVLDPFGEGLYAAADIVCQMSRWEEAFGWTIAEAMTYAKPLVATRVGAIPELVREGETGFLVERGDTAAMAEKILLLARDEALRRRVGQGGRRLAEAEFDIHKNVAELLRLYRLR